MPNTLNGKLETKIYEVEQREEVLTEQTPARSTDDWAYVTKDLLDSLPQVWTRGLLYFLVVFVSIILPWAMLSKVDETGTARGRLEPKGKTVRLDSAVAGTVAEIRVKEGDYVRTGQTLLVLESELVKAELRQAQEKLEGQLNRLSQLKSSKSQLVVSLTTQQQQNQSQQLEKQTQIDQAQQNLNALKNSYDLQKDEKLAQVNQARQTLEHSQTASKLVSSSLASGEREVERYRSLWQSGVVSETNVVQKQDIAKDRQQLYEQNKSDIQQAKLRLVEQQSSYERTIRQANADIEQAQLRIKEQERSYQTLTRSGQLALLKIDEQQKNLQTEITTLQAEIAQNRSQIVSLKFQLGQRELRATVNGRVFQLPIQRAGSVVQSGTMVAEIAPQASPLMVRAQMATTESGFLRKGLPVKLKFDAYPFQDYGVIEGELLEISPTTIEVDTPNGKVAAYDLQIALKQNCLVSANKCITLHPGDTATAEVIVRQRRIIDFLLDPFKQLQQGGLKL
ncbi:MULTISPECIES: HlyD family efflux transporter periplasmic adaptor subunit [unclassified Nostoc]|uniref:HlyD family efflux transporter periplasmic adaptor subunit n=1 Tax=unclassified Nostoc TaxID=2593658 RepID=UPI0025AA55FC|nr:MULTISPECIES: HlyD family efflux transporter periplasmic adaptor subunit [unclassified Nostoc]MDM9585310.1 HlyD family efflux transporter periplasmic adaptor subunit [Nostoc sp. GT001]MDZ7949298.1 HlyD family efflux transporter periplasmic adaptor subunit [Nostoc sp. EfeVER01]MDZ7993494.1 HlyD family efflux transporter periplasmic adaptor subunit [Nostoc sp. EspVER01]